jgi:hypothetical protein
VPGVGLRDRVRAAGNRGPEQQPYAVVGAQPGRVEPELGGQRLVQREQLRAGCVLGLPGDGQLRELAGEAVPEDDGGCRCDAHTAEGT